jgi:hypothetical protein
VRLHHGDQGGLAFNERALAEGESGRFGDEWVGIAQGAEQEVGGHWTGTKTSDLGESFATNLGIGVADQGGPFRHCEFVVTRQAPHRDDSSAGVLVAEGLT